MFHFDRRRLCFSRPSIGILLFAPPITILAAIETAWATFDLIRVHSTTGALYRFCGVVAIIAMWTLVIGAPAGFIGVVIRSLKISTIWWHLATWHAIFTTIGGVLKTIALLASRSGWLNLCNAEPEYLFNGVDGCKRYWRLRMLGHVVVYFGLSVLLIMSAMLLTGFVAELVKNKQADEDFVVVNESRRADNIGMRERSTASVRFVAPPTRPIPKRTDSARSDDASVTPDRVIDALPSGNFTEVSLSEKKADARSISSSFAPDADPFDDKSTSKESSPPPFDLHTPRSSFTKEKAAEAAEVQRPPDAHLPDGHRTV